MDEVNRDRIEPLRKQWELEKSPKLSLQLAEEYGRGDDYLSAITVLRTGLTRHPRHVASRVLLARYLVELEQWPEARETLDQVARVDPTHMIANKLLVKTCLATGDLPEARNRLDLYQLLNESDPDIEELERALAAAAPTAEAEAEEAVAEAAEVSPEAAEVSPEAAAPPAVEAAPADVPLSVPERSATPQAREEPFGDLFGFGERERAVATAPAADIFDLGRPRFTPAAEERLLETEPAGEEIPPEEATLEPEAAAPVAEAPAAIEDEGEEAASSAAAEPAADETPPASVSLGRLYLQQGHADEAESTFTSVLESDPDNVAAKIGLAAARGGGAWRVSALDLASRQALASADATERKRAVLAGYLERLRAPGPAAG